LPLENIAMSDPAVSTIIPTYNRAHLVVRAVTSALRASRPGDEVIVIDNASTDGTPEALSHFGNRIRYVRTDRRGAGVARNLGVQHAQHPLVAFLDSDDEWTPEKLEVQRRLMASRPDVLVSFTDFKATMPDGQVERHFIRAWHKDQRSWNEILASGQPFSSLAALPDDVGDFAVHIGSMYEQLLGALYMFTSTVMVRRVEAGPALQFPEDLPIYEDWVCFARLAKAGKAAYLDTELSWNHGHRGERLTAVDTLFQAEHRLELIDRVWGRDPEFLAAHASEYDGLKRRFQLLRARSLLGKGRTAEARRVLEHVAQAPMTYRVAAMLPAPVVYPLVLARSAAVLAAHWFMTALPKPVG
jgi:glycosyltransferase involved in cell wall biosynthesis